MSSEDPSDQSTLTEAVDNNKSDFVFPNCSKCNANYLLYRLSSILCNKVLFTKSRQRRVTF